MAPCQHWRTGRVFLNLDLFNAPTAELYQRYDVVGVPDDATATERRPSTSGDGAE